MRFDRHEVSGLISDLSFLDFSDRWSHVSWEFDFGFAGLVNTLSVGLVNIIKLRLNLILAEQPITLLHFDIDPIMHIIMANKLKLIFSQIQEKVFETECKVILVFGDGLFLRLLKALLEAVLNWLHQRNVSQKGMRLHMIDKAARSLLQILFHL